MNWILFIVLLIEVLFISRLEYKIWRTYYTPFNFLSIPYTIVLFFILLLAPSFGFFEIYWKSIFVWIIGFFLFWLPSLFYGIIILKKKSIIKTPFMGIPIYIRNLQLLKFITIISLALIYYKVALLSQLYGIGSLEFENKFGRGIEAHLSILLRFLLIYYIVIINKKDKILWILTILIVFSAVIYGSKSWILIPIISGLLIRFIINGNKIKFSVKVVSLTGISIFSVFFMVYYFSIGKNLKFWDYTHFLLNHITLYFSAGIVAFSEYLKNSGDTSIDPFYIFGSLINFLKKIMNYELKNIVSDLWTVINAKGNISNVKTIFGTIYIYAGWLFGSLFVLFFSFLHYSLLILSIYKKNILLVIIYFFWSSILIFGWFELYYHLIAYFELPLMGIIVYFITSLRKSQHVKS